MHTIVITLIELSQNSSSPKNLIPNQLMAMMVTRKTATHTPGLTWPRTHCGQECCIGVGVISGLCRWLAAFRRPGAALIKAEPWGSAQRREKCLVLLRHDHSQARNMLLLLFTVRLEARLPCAVLSYRRGSVQLLDLALGNQAVGHYKSPPAPAHALETLCGLAARFQHGHLEPQPTSLVVFGRRKPSLRPRVWQQGIQGWRCRRDASLQH